MTNRTPSSGSGGLHDLAGGGNRYEALLEVLEHEKSQAARDRAREEEEWRQRKKRRGRIWPVAALLVVAVWLWIFPPGFLRLDPPPPQPIEQEEAALRFIMSVQAQRIQAFQQDRGRLPETLDEAGPPLPGMQYTVLNTDLYQLTGATDRLTLTYRSDLPLDDFAGSSADVVGATPGS